MTLELKQIILMVGTTFLFSVLFMNVVKKIGIHIGAIDMPGGRHIHNVPMPKLGGLGIYAGFLLGYMLFGSGSLQMNSILIGSFIMLMVGLFDDIKSIEPRDKFIGQVISAAVIPLYGGILLEDISAFGIYLNFGWLSPLVTIVFIVSVMNCINFIDGIDGLSGGIASIYFITVGIIGSFINGSNSLDVILTFIMLGSTLGFLWHNFNPASILIGDCGAMFLGFIIAVIALLGFKNVTLTSFIIPVFLLAIPIMDTLFAIIRRLLKKESISKADREHTHHQLLNMNLSKRKTVLVLYCVDILFAIASIMYVLGDSLIAIFLYITLFIIVLWFVLFTNVIRNHDKTKKVLKKFKQKKK